MIENQENIEDELELMKEHISEVEDSIGAIEDGHESLEKHISEVERWVGAIDDDLDFWEEHIETVGGIKRLIKDMVRKISPNMYENLA
jgi:chromosome segregation ATPase